MRKREYKTSRVIIRRCGGVPLGEWRLALAHEDGCDMEIAIGDDLKQYIFCPSRRQARAIAKALMEWAERKE
jgi:hypothetical protein